ncbi:hypothetical protein IscW_ISCW012056, partial [Ixodes scapularis]
MFLTDRVLQKSVRQDTATHRAHLWRIPGQAQDHYRQAHSIRPWRQSCPAGTDGE